ncbi:ATP synthase mitochondrial F1 complex assembly factor 1 isoform X2 [Centruroides vittatus]|uniref:ATP synthase mitochondrial F1 complex assembly factor 1 isoform X2 n=1 Tax=Centruroides vittatus TaxID=120091 RepID=UPI00350EA520
MASLYTRLFNRYLLAQSLRRNRNFSEQADEVNEIKQNPYYEKYAEKIARLQKTSPEEFLNRIKSSQKEKKQKSIDYGNDVIKEITKEPYKAFKNISYGKEKTLNDVMNIDLLQDKTSEEISKIWQEYHKNKKGISAVIPDTNYANIYSTSLKFPVFLYPLPRKDGYEFVVSQFLNHECHFTFLINFQAYKENAPECLRIIHYPDLQKEKVGSPYLQDLFSDKAVERDGRAGNFPLAERKLGNCSYAWRI